MKATLNAISLTALAVTARFVAWGLPASARPMHSMVAVPEPGELSVLTVGTALLGGAVGPRRGTH